MVSLARALVFCIAAVLLSAEALKAKDITVVLYRTEQGTELFLSGKADVLFSVFDAAVSVLPTNGPHVDFEAFQNGTWTIGDILIEKSKFKIGAEPAAFEAMSFMLHPKEERLPFDTPLDGMIAIGVCSATQTDAKYELSELTAYVGYFTEHSAVDAPLSLEFPDTIGTDLTITVNDFGSEGQYSHYTIEINDGRDLTLDAHKQLGSLKLYLFGTVLGAATVLLSIGIPKIGRQKRLTRQSVNSDQPTIETA